MAIELIFNFIFDIKNYTMIYLIGSITSIMALGVFVDIILLIVILGRRDKAKLCKSVLIIVSIVVVIRLLFYIFKPFHLEYFSKIDTPKVIYTIDNERKVYSKFEEIYYVKYSKMNLGDALSNGNVTIDKIVENMKLYHDWDDSIMYEYERKDNHYASIHDKYIYLIVCKSPTNKNYYLTDSSSDYYICRDN